MIVTDNTVNDNKNSFENNSKNRRPNFLIIMVDEERFPSVYETDVIKNWRKENLKAQNFLKRNGIEFLNHYAASTACAPSRASLYTGQYPSLHGVTQTDGGGSTAFSPDVFWLDPNTVPTFGDYLRTVGYKTFWKGKWHVSHEDIIIPGTHDSYLSYDENGIPISKNVQLYLKANRFDEYGFDGWVGPEPHGSNPRNSGSSSSTGLSGRDVVYSQDVVDLIKSLQHNYSKENCDDEPWAIVASFVNPHDIAIYGEISRLIPEFNFDVDSSVPSIPPSPTAHEDLSTKPRVQASYREVYPSMIQPLFDTETFRRLYYSLQLTVDQEIYKVLKALKESSFYDDTIIIYLSDHGDLLGSHGGLFQKWYNAYEESIHVPLIIHNPKIAPNYRTVDNLTSHIDLVPTILGLANIDVDEAQEKLKRNHTEVHKLAGRDLTPLILNKQNLSNDPLYFMTDDDPSRTLNSDSFLGVPYEPVVQPCHIETVIVKLPTGKNRKHEIWKYSRYFDNPQFWSKPGCKDEFTLQKGAPHVENDKFFELCVTTVKISPVSDEFEMYNLTQDPIEANNLTNPKFKTPETTVVELILQQILASQCEKKRIYPSSGDVPGKPKCKTCFTPLLNL